MTILATANCRMLRVSHSAAFCRSRHGGGLALGVVIAIFLEFSDKSIRTEKDAARHGSAPSDSVPWLGDDEDDAANGNGRRRFWGRAVPLRPKNTSTSSLA